MIVTGDQAHEPQKRLTGSLIAQRVARMMLLEKAAGMLGGQDRLADALGIKGRSLRAKFTADRGISDSDLEATAQALEGRVNEIIWTIEKIRNQIGPGEVRNGG